MLAPSSTPAAPAAPILTVALLVLATLAVTGAPEKKVWVALRILRWMAIGVVVGMVIGLIFSNPQAAGSMAALLMQIMGIGASIDQMRQNKKHKMPTLPKLPK